MNINLKKENIFHRTLAKQNIVLKKETMKHLGLIWHNLCKYMILSLSQESE
jgi:hypothetical protein